MIYKLTDENGRTYGDTQWGPGVTHEANGAPDRPLCSDGWIHAYEHPLLAVLFNPIHADFKSPRLWEADGEIGIRDGQLKCGCRKLTTIREIPLLVVTTEQRIAFGILCAKEVCADAEWNRWADGWLDGSDRAAGAAAAARAASAAARAARAAWAAVWAAWAAEAAARAAWAAQAAAQAAAEASSNSLDMLSILRRVVKPRP